MQPFEKVCILVLDSLGVGAMPDAGRFGDAGTNTLMHTSRAVSGIALPNLAKIGLAHLTHIEGTAPHPTPLGGHGKMSEQSDAKDTITGHWEMAGVPIEEPFNVFPDGFPPEILQPFIERTGREVMGNIPASGTEIIKDLGVEHMETGKWIVYTSADSVFQIAAHEDVIPLEELYEACHIAREICDGPRIARIIARPFIGKPGAFQRTYNRHDYSMLPPKPTLCEKLTEAKVPVVGVGKIADIFAHQGVPQNIHTEGNTDGLKRTVGAIQDLERGLVFTNLVDFDMLYGHRRNPEGYAEALLEVDEVLPSILDTLGENGLLMITADHGCDPTYPAHTDHTREYVPILCASRRFNGSVDLGIRESFADLGQTVAENFRITVPTGSSFYSELGAAL
jgi:phosphopentomutase